MVNRMIAGQLRREQRSRSQVAWMIGERELRAEAAMSEHRSLKEIPGTLAWSRQQEGFGEISRGERL